MFREIQGEDCTSCAITQFNLAWSLREQERFDEARDALLQADETFRRHYGEDYGTRQGSFYFELAAVSNQMGKYEEALDYHDKATALYLRELGPRSSLYALSLYNHAQTHRDHGRCDLALPLLREAREVHVELFGEDGEWVRKDDARIAQCEEMLE